MFYNLGEIMEEKILNIHGIAVDRKTHPNDVFLRENEPSKRNKDILDLLLSGKLEKMFPNGFLIYIHKTKPHACGSIVNSGLMINEEGGYLESTMSKVFDSKSKYPEGDMNYLFNAINTPNQYGSESVIGVFARKESTISPYPENYGEICVAKKVLPENILGYISNDGKFHSGKMMKNIEYGKVNDK